MPDDMTASNKIVLNEAKDNQALLEPSHGIKKDKTFSQPESIWSPYIMNDRHVP